MRLCRREQIAGAARSLSTPWLSATSSAATPPIPRILIWNGKIVWKVESYWRVVGPGGSKPLRVDGLTSVIDLASGGGTSWAVGNDGAGHLAITRVGTTATWLSWWAPPRPSSSTGDAGTPSPPGKGSTPSARPHCLRQWSCSAAPWPWRSTTASGAAGWSSYRLIPRRRRLSRAIRSPVRASTAVPQRSGRRVKNEGVLRPISSIPDQS